MKILDKNKMIAISIAFLMIASMTLIAMPVNAQTTPSQATITLPLNTTIGGINFSKVVSWPLSEAVLAAAGINYGWGERLPSGVTPDYSFVTKAYMNIAPNPVGVGQGIQVNLWYTPSSNRCYKSTNYTVTITAPDGSTEVKDSTSWTSERTTWFEYFPSQIGTYTFKFDLPGQYWPAGVYYDYTYAPGGVSASPIYNMTKSQYAEPSSTGEQTLVVQADPVLSWPPSPLPTDYWTRPVAKENREWWPILGGFPANGWWGGGSLWDATYPGNNVAWSSSYHFYPYITAPNTAHIMRVEQQSNAGIVGGMAGQLTGSGSVSSPTVEYAGFAYETKNELINGVPTSCAVCYNIRTGEIKYAIPISQGGFTPTEVTYLDPAPVETPYYTTTASWSVELIGFSGNRLIKVDQDTGRVVGNYSLSPFTGTGGTFYRQGDGTGQGPYVLNVQNIGNSSNPNYRLIKWSTRGSAANLVDRVISNTSYARSSLPSLIDWNAGLGATAATISFEDTYTGLNLTGYNLWTGATMWSIIDDDIPDVTSNYVADHGLLAVFVKHNPAGTKGGFYKAFNLNTGAVVWESPTGLPYPWGETGFTAYSVSSAYGNIIMSTYAGVAAWNWTTGAISWIYTDPGQPFETPYNLPNFGAENPFFFRCDIVDGKVFAVTSEHGETYPLYRGWGLRVINVTTGELIWKIAIATGGTGFDSPPLGVYGDGYAIGSSGQNGAEYTFGIGPSATTVDTTKVAVPLGTSALITGSVMDMSPAQPNTPCVSAASMALAMEHIHLQLPVGGVYQNESLTGVPVSLIAVGSSGTVIDLGTVMTNGYYGTFSKAWTPPAEDTYTIAATFAGSDAYGVSSAATAVTVGPAAAPYPTAQPPQAAPDNTALLYATLAAVIVAIIVSLIALFRKR